MMFAVLDIETTGMDPLTDRVCEIAAVFADADVKSATSASYLINPSREIPPTASAIHHITDEMVADAPFFDQVIAQFMGADIYVAHNNRFDMKFLPDFKRPWIDTYRCALAVWPDAPSHSNQALAYWLKTPRPVDGHHHRALFDAWTTFFILVRLVEVRSIAELIDISSRPAMLSIMKFGKHAGQKFSDLPVDYLRWMERQDFDEDVSFTVAKELQRRDKRLV